MTTSIAICEISSVTFTFAGLGFGILYFEELAPGLRPAERSQHARWSAACSLQGTVAARSVGLQVAGPTRQMPGRIFFRAAGGEVVKRSRRRPTLEQSVIAKMSPEAGGLDASLGQKRHGCFVKFSGPAPRPSTRIRSWIGCIAIAQAPT